MKPYVSCLATLEKVLAGKETSLSAITYSCKAQFLKNVKFFLNRLFYILPALISRH
jgi:hypothetical protein